MTTWRAPSTERSQQRAAVGDGGAVSGRARPGAGRGPVGRPGPRRRRSPGWAPGPWRRTRCWWGRSAAGRRRVPRAGPGRRRRPRRRPWPRGVPPAWAAARSRCRGWRRGAPPRGCPDGRRSSGRGTYSPKGTRWTFSKRATRVAVRAPGHDLVAEGGGRDRLGHPHHQGGVERAGQAGQGRLARGTRTAGCRGTPRPRARAPAGVPCRRSAGSSSRVAGQLGGQHHGRVDLGLAEPPGPAPLDGGGW